MAEYPSTQFLNDTWGTIEEICGHWGDGLFRAVAGPRDRSAVRPIIAYLLDTKSIAPSRTEVSGLLASAGSRVPRVQFDEVPRFGRNASFCGHIDPYGGEYAD